MNANALAALASNPQLLQTYMSLFSQGQAQNAAQTQAAQQSAMIQSLLGQASQREFEAKQANESRYMDILGLLGGVRNDVLGDVNQFGQSIVNDTNTNFDKARNNALADLAARGLSGSTIRAGIEDTNARERSAAQTRNQDALLQNRSAANERTMAPITGVMERRTDSYPDSIANLLLQYGMAGGSLPANIGTPNMPASPVYGGGGTANRQVGFGDNQASPLYNSAPTPRSLGTGYGPTQISPGMAQPQSRFASVGSANANDSAVPADFMQILNYIGQQANAPAPQRYVNSGQGGFAPVQWQKTPWGGTQPISNATLATKPQFSGVPMGYANYGGYQAPTVNPPVNLYPAQPRRPQTLPQQPYRRPTTQPYSGDINYLMAAGLV